MARLLRSSSVALRLCWLLTAGPLLGVGCGGDDERAPGGGAGQSGAGAAGRGGAAPAGAAGASSGGSGQSGVGGTVSGSSGQSAAGAAGSGGGGAAGAPGGAGAGQSGAGQSGAGQGGAGQGGATAGGKGGAAGAGKGGAAAGGNGGASQGGTGGGQSGQVRPIGTGYLPPYVRSYDSAVDIPADALDASAFATIDAWLDACIAQNKPGKIGSGTYAVSSTARYAPKGIYGYGATRPVFEAKTPGRAWLFLRSQDAVFRHLEFRGFGVVFGATRPTTPLTTATGMSPSPYHSNTSNDKYLRRVWAGAEGAAVPMTRVGQITLTAGASGSVTSVVATRTVANSTAWSDADKTDQRESLTLLSKAVPYATSLAATAQAVAAAISAEVATHGCTATADGARITVLKAEGYGFLGLAANVSGDLAAEADAQGPDLDVQHCSFTNCDVPVYAVSDSTAMGRVDFSANALDGTWGGVALSTSRYSDVFMAGNSWRHCTADNGRQQLDYKNNSIGTFALIGINTPVHLGLQSNEVRIENNEAEDIESLQTREDFNGAVFADVRNAIESKDGANSVSFNSIVRVKNLRGHEDANAIYGKVGGIVVERNYIEDFGSRDTTKDTPAYGDGTETAGILFKPPGSEQTQKMIIRGNIFEKPPANVAVIKVDSHLGYAEISFNEIRGWDGTGLVKKADGYKYGAVRWFETSAHVAVVGNRFLDAPSPANLIVFHSFKAPKDAKLFEVSNNEAIGQHVGDEARISFTSALDESYLSQATVGLNRVSNGDKLFTMLLSLGQPGSTAIQGSENATKKTYTPPTIP